MGATTFFTKGFGKTAGEAFDSKVEWAENYHGSKPYTGTIKEKDGFTVIPESEHKGLDKEKYAHDLINEGDERVDDKWGNAGAINLSGTKAAKQYRARNNLKGKHGDVWLFFGWASC